MNPWLKQSSEDGTDQGIVFDIVFVSARFLRICPIGQISWYLLLYGPTAQIFVPLELSTKIKLET